jgi:hypothetical protein
MAATCVAAVVAAVVAAAVAEMQSADAAASAQPVVAARVVQAARHQAAAQARPGPHQRMLLLRCTSRWMDCVPAAPAQQIGRRVSWFTGA